MRSRGVPAHIRFYVAVWCGYFSLLVLLPVRYGRAEWDLAFGALVAFVITSTITAVLADLALRRPTSRAVDLSRIAAGPFTTREVERLVLAGIAMSLVGFVLLAYDRIVIQGIDFSKGLAVARNLWRDAAQDRQGVSSWASALGYIFGFTFLAASVVAFVHWESLGRHVRGAVILGVPTLALANSVLTGGRSILVVQFAALATGAALRAASGRRVVPGRFISVVMVTGVFVLVALGYSLYVFSSRAIASSIAPSQYTVEMLRYLGGVPTRAYFALDALPFQLASILQFAVIAGSYVTHSAGTFESVLFIGQTPGKVSFGFVLLLLDKLGVPVPESQEWILGGRFLSLPGSLWYDFGWTGLGVGAIAMGLLLAAVPRLAASRGLGGLGTGAATAILVVAFMSPLLVAVDSLAFPFMMVGFVLLDIVQRCSAGRRNWLLLGCRVVFRTRDRP